MNWRKHIAILGGGPAGLAVGYYAKKAGFPFTIFEAGERLGGNCVTLRYRDFLYDSGAHRLHDKSSAATAELQMLLGEDLKKIEVPSRIFYNGKLIDFPLTPLNLLVRIGPVSFLKAAGEVLAARLKKAGDNRDFESFTLHTYGRTIADMFLLNYSEKLWGAPCNKLSPSIAGKRLQGLNLKTFLLEAVAGKKAKTEHLEGSFYYPTLGIGMIAKKLEEVCGEPSIRRNARVTKIFHDGSRITAVELNGGERAPTELVASSLRLDFLLYHLEPQPPGDILDIAKSLRYRSMILAALFLARESITNDATVYFPQAGFPFTRIYEPRNRSPHMSPPGKTSLVAEIPCQQDDERWRLPDEELTRQVRAKLMEIGWVREEEILGSCVMRMVDAYPILEMGFEEKIQEINGYLGHFNNLKSTGRNGRFVYSWIHNMMEFGREIVEEFRA
jgi:protoporphyrinogen oxidase